MTSRITGLDIARGVAILGTLGTNIWIFSHPGGMLGYLGSPTTQGAPAWQTGIEAVLQQLAQGKFLGLLTLMFGIGLAIQAESAQQRGRRWPGPYLWRVAILFLDGLLHYLLVVEFDVLMGYAVTGAVAAYVVARSPRAQRIWITVTATVHAALVALLTAGAWLAGDSSLGGMPNPNPYRDGSWWDLVLLRIDNPVVFRFEPVFLLFLGIAMFLVGNRLYRAGLFTAEGARLRRRLMLPGAVAFPIDMWLGLSSANWLFLTRYGTAPVVALGLLALIAGLTRSRPTGWASTRLAELGRVALSGYVLQNLLASVLFYGWGFDLGSVAPEWRLAATVAGWVTVSALVLTAAHLWLRRFRRGPLEWLWAVMYEALASPGTRKGAHPDRVDAPAEPLTVTRAGG